MRFLKEFYSLQQLDFYHGLISFLFGFFTNWTNLTKELYSFTIGYFMGLLTFLC